MSSTTAYTPSSDPTISSEAPTTKENSVSNTHTAPTLTGRTITADEAERGAPLTSREILVITGQNPHPLSFTEGVADGAPTPLIERLAASGYLNDSNSTATLTARTVYADEAEHRSPRTSNEILVITGSTAPSLDDAPRSLRDRLEVSDYDYDADAEHWTPECGGPRFHVMPTFTTLDGSQFMLTKKARAALNGARQGEKFILSEEALAKLTIPGRTPKLNGRRIILTEEQLAQVISGRALHELRDRNVTYEESPAARSERFTARQLETIRERSDLHLAWMPQGPEWHRNPNGHLITL